MSKMLIEHRETEDGSEHFAVFCACCRKHVFTIMYDEDDEATLGWTIDQFEHQHTCEAK